MLSGLIAEYASWKWVFGVCAIMAGAVSVAGILFVPPPPPSTILANTESIGSKLPPVDWIGGTLITIGMIALMFALTEGNVVGWATPWIPVLIVVSIIIIAIFVAWQIYLERHPEGRPPLMKVSVFRNRRFSAVMIIMGLFAASFNNFIIFATFYYQDFQGYSPLQTMLRFIPTGIGGALIALVVSQLLGRVPTTFIVLTGSVAVAISNLLFAVPIPPTTSYFAFGMPAMVLAVLGADTTFPCVTLFTSSALPPQDQAVGAALINAVSQFGRAIGLAISTATQTAVMAHERGVSVKNVGPVKQWDGPSLQGIHAASWVAFGFGVCSAIIILVAFRSMEIVGKVKPHSSPETTKDGVLSGKQV